MNAQMAAAVIASAVFGMAGSAMAAGSWNGVYLNVGAGYGGWSADTTTVNPTTGACVLCTVQTQGGNGGLAKLGVGYDHQFGPNLVAGVLLDYDFSNFKGTIQDQGPFFAGNIKQKSAWAAGGRIGWLFSPDTLTYLSAGYSRADFSSTNMVVTFQGTATAFGTPGFKKGDWFLGLGMETRAGTNWSLRGEYRYVAYGTETIRDTAGASSQASITFKPTVQTATVQAVYRF